MTSKPLHGMKIRRLRDAQGMTQVEAAKRLGISASYFNLIEHNQRPLTVSLLFKFGKLFDVDVQSFSDGDEARLSRDLRGVFADSLFGENRVGDDDLDDVAASFPALAETVINLYSAYSNARETIQALGEKLSDEAFLPATSHEMREALTSIRTFSEILHHHKDVPDEERRRFREIVVEESSRLSTIVDRVIEIAEGGRKQALVQTRPLADHVDGFIEAQSNHFPELEAAAEEFRSTLDQSSGDLTAGLLDTVTGELNVAVQYRPSTDYRDRGPSVRAEQHRVHLPHQLPTADLNFALARLIGERRQRGEIEAIVEQGPAFPDRARPLVEAALTKYFAGAVLMPYQAFLEAALECGYDIELLGQRFEVSFEQACHRLTTLNRPGASGTPFHLVKVDIAGNVIARYEGSGMRIPRYGGVCPLWNIHFAFATPGETITQLSEMPDGTTYFCFARTVERPFIGHGQPRSYVAIGLGCDKVYADELIYASGKDFDAKDMATPVGINCRICERNECDQRALRSLTGIGSNVSL